MQDRLLRRREVEKITGISRSSIYRLMPDGEFPRPVKVGPAAVGHVPSGGGRATSRPGWSHGRWLGVILDRPTRPRYGLDHPNPRFDFP